MGAVHDGARCTGQHPVGCSVPGVALEGPHAADSDLDRTRTPVPPDHFMLNNLCIAAQRNFAPSHPLFTLIAMPCKCVVQGRAEVAPAACQRRLL